MFQDSMRAVELILVIQTVGVVLSDKNICEMETDCACRVSDTHVFDFAALNKRNSSLPFTTEVSNRLVSWSPCLTFTIGTCVNASICEYGRISGHSDEIVLGTRRSQQFYMSVNDTPEIVYREKDRNSQTTLVTTIKLICNSSLNPGYLVTDSDAMRDSSVYLGLKFISMYSCLQSSLRFEVAVDLFSDVLLLIMLFVVVFFLTTAVLSFIYRKCCISNKKWEKVEQHELEPYS